MLLFPNRVICGGIHQILHLGDIWGFVFNLSDFNFTLDLGREINGFILRPDSAENVSFCAFQTLALFQIFVFSLRRIWINIGLISLESESSGLANFYVDDHIIIQRVYKFIFFVDSAKSPRISFMLNLTHRNR